MKHGPLFAHLAAGLIAAWSTNAAASVTINITKVGPDVVAVTSGTFVPNGLTFMGYNMNGVTAEITPSKAEFASGNAAPMYTVFYSGLVGPADFGDGIPTQASAFVGDTFYFWAWLGNYVGVENDWGFHQSLPLSATTTFANSSLRSLGLYPGSYVFTAPASTTPIITVNVVRRAVPEPATWAMMLLGFGAVGFAVRRRSRAKTAVLAVA